MQANDEKRKIVTADDLHKELLIGVHHDGNHYKDYTLLRTNGVAEIVFTDKSQSKPYTWMANVLTIACANIGPVAVGAAARNQYSKTSSITPPPIVLALPIADASSMLMEIHRTVWKAELREQDTICKYCGHKMIMDIDLDRIKLLPEQEEKLSKDWAEIVVDLPVGYTFEGLQIKGTDQNAYDEFKGMNFNRFIFRIPVIDDAIRNEKQYNDNIKFWRRIAFDCLLSMQAVSPEGNTLATLPDAVKAIIAMKLFDEYLDFADLDCIRVSLRDEPPTLPFYYLEECANPGCRQETPITIESSSFFSV